MDKAGLEHALARFPICEYAFLTTKELPFSEKVRYICETECPRYGKSWSCPPAVGTVEECRQRCLEYDSGFVFTTVSEGADVEHMDSMLAMQKSHEKITREVKDLFEEAFGQVLVLSTESCAFCETCTCPEKPCRYPRYMQPCMEGYGILVTELAETAGLAFMNGSGVVTWFSLILYHEKERPGQAFSGKEESQ